MSRQPRDGLMQICYDNTTDTKASRSVCSAMTELCVALQWNDDDNSKITPRQRSSKEGRERMFEFLDKITFIICAEIL